MANVEKKVESLLEPVIQNLGYELYDIEYVKEGKDFFLRILIDKTTGVNIEDCEIVNNAINPLLDEADYIKEQYFLEVSSPGIERVLRKEKHFQSHRGELVEIKLFQPVGKKKIWQGILKDFSMKEIVLVCEEQEISLERRNISLIKTVYQW